MKTIIVSLMLLGVSSLGVSQEVELPKNVKVKHELDEKGVMFSSALRVKADLGLDAQKEMAKSLVASFSKGSPRGTLDLEIDEDLAPDAYEIDIEDNDIDIEGGSPAAVTAALELLKKFLPKELAGLEKGKTLAPVMLKAMEIKHRP